MPWWYRDVAKFTRNDRGNLVAFAGGRVDHAHHNNQAQKALADAVALSDAVQRAMDLTSEDDMMDRRKLVRRQWASSL